MDNLEICMDNQNIRMNNYEDWLLTLPVPVVLD